jgi:hypothetical protein
MYKKEIMGNISKEHLFSPPLSFAPSRSDDRGGLFLTSWISAPFEEYQED